MAVVHKNETFVTGKQILVFPDHYVSVAHTFLKDDAAAVTVDGRKVIKAGTIYPANDETAKGVVWADYDVTDGDVTGALIIHGFVKTKAIPATPTANAIGALNMIKFLPVVAHTATLTTTALEVDVDEEIGTEHDVRVAIGGGVTFRDAAATLDNWTITGESTTKVEVESITVGAGGAYVIIHTKNSAAAAAGSVTVVPLPAATSTGAVPSSAVTIVTVA